MGLTGSFSCRNFHTMMTMSRKREMTPMGEVYFPNSSMSRMRHEGNMMPNATIPSKAGWLSPENSPTRLYSS